MGVFDCRNFKFCDVKFELSSLHHNSSYKSLLGLLVLVQILNSFSFDLEV